MTFRSSSLWALALMVVCTFAYGAASVETFSVNLNPLIDRAVRHPTQFAVNVARRIDSESSGRWQIDQGNATWDYSIRIPSAVSMGFHASRLMLPKEGSLTITGGGQSFTYYGHDLRRADFWSRTVKGDQIAIHMTAPKQLRHQALIEIAAFQAGYRSLSAEMNNNPHYEAIKPRTAQSAASCVENYVCDAAPTTQNGANASVALVIGNTFECSGTLLNDVPQDGAPYVLTARHCENGEVGGGDPGAASSVQVFWNSVTPCGQALLSIFDSYSQVQSGATTVVEQQDEWLIRLDAQPAVTGVYYAGWDAGGTELEGGYSVEYASAQTQQYVTWAGSAITENLSAQTLGVGYASTYWGVVNSLGSVDHGASGSGLFDGNNHVVGSLSRAVVAQCPVTPPPAPSTNTVVALYNKLASTWKSTADASSTTGSATLALALDPANTGTTAIAGVAGVPPSASISTSQSSAQTGQSIVLVFEGSPGAVCTASGGIPGDGWTGTLNAYPGGTITVTESQTGNVTYGMTCTSGSRSSSAQVTATWSLAPPALTFYDQTFPDGLYAGVVNPFVWRSNQSSCMATGGVAGDGWSGTLPGSGQVNVTEIQPGTYSYTLTCGAGSQSISQSLTLTFAAPTASLTMYSQTGLRFGQSINLAWNGTGGCTASGGAAGDGWAGPKAGTFGAIYLTEQAAGTYTFTMSCGPAAIAAVAQATYTFSGSAPTAVLTAAQPTQLIDLSVQTSPTLLTWTSNVQPCGIDYSGPVTGSLLSGYPSQGIDTQPQVIAGLYTYVLTCGYGAAQAKSTATINWTQQPTPLVTLTTQGNEFLLSGGYLAWTTNVLPCIGSGGTAGDGWTGTLPYYDGGPDNRGIALVSEPEAGTYTFTIICGVGNVASAQATAVYNNAGGNQLTLTPGTSQVVIGEPTYLTWNSAIGPCTGYGGTSSDGWNGSHPQQGSASVIETVGNSNYILSLVCGVGSQAVEAQTEVAVFGPATDVSVSLYLNNSSSEVGQPVTLQWSANQAASCTATGGITGDGWTGTLPVYGSMTVAEAQAGSVTYGITCQNGSLSGQSTIIVQWVAAPAVTLSSSTLNAVWGTALTLTWSSSNGASGCTASEDGGQNGTWNGPVSDSGSASVQEVAGAVHTYTISCSSNYGNVLARVTVNFSAPPVSTGGSASNGSSSSSTSSGGSSHGGGGLQPATLAILAILAAMRLRSHFRMDRRGRRTG
jgi:lysyl endopeptidase